MNLITTFLLWLNISIALILLTALAAMRGVMPSSNIIIEELYPSQ